MTRSVFPAAPRLGAAAVLALALAMTGGAASAQLLNGQGRSSAPEPAPAPAPLPAPAPAEAPAQTGPSRSVDVFENWSVQCQPMGDLRDCYIETRIRQTGEDGVPRDLVLLRMRSADAGLTASVQVPEGVRLDAPLALVAGEATVSGGYVLCAGGRCLAEAEVGAGLTEALSRSETMEVVFAVPGPRDIRVPVNLAGFAAALTAFDAL